MECVQQRLGERQVDSANRDNNFTEFYSKMVKINIFNGWKLERENHEKYCPLTGKRDGILPKNGELGLNRNKRKDRNNYYRSQ